MPTSTPLRADFEQLLQVYAKAFLAGESFSTLKKSLAFAAAETNQKLTSDGQTVRQIEEAVEAAMLLAARTLLDQNSTLPIRTQYAKIVELYNQQPRLASRSSTRVLRQQYSTPLPLAYLAGVLACVNPEKVVYDPTAGHGALLLTANPKRAIANEIDPCRSRSLRQQGFESVTEYDAIDYLPEAKIDVVLTNPPFGTPFHRHQEKPCFTLTEGLTTSKAEFYICKQALSLLGPAGRAVLILGSQRGKDEDWRSKQYNSYFYRNFYHWLYHQYRVTQHFSVDGDLYQKQGAGFPVDVIVIDGHGTSERSLPAADVPVLHHDWSTLIDLLPGESPDPAPKPIYALGGDPRGWMLGRQGKTAEVYPDWQVCSGAMLDERCPHADLGRMPLPVPLDPESPTYNLDKGKPGDLSPPCCKSQLSSLRHWQGHGGRFYPEDLLDLRLFKCRMGCWFVVPGLYDSHPQQILDDPPTVCEPRPAPEFRGTMQFYYSGISSKEKVDWLLAAGAQHILINPRHVKLIADHFDQFSHVILDNDAFFRFRAKERGLSAKPFDLSEYLKIARSYPFTFVVVPDEVGNEASTEAGWEQVKDIDLPWLPVVQWRTESQSVNIEKVQQLLHQFKVVAIGGLVQPLRDDPIPVIEGLTALCEQFPGRLHLFGLHEPEAIARLKTIAYSIDSSKLFRMVYRQSLLQIAPTSNNSRLREVPAKQVGFFGGCKDLFIESSRQLEKFLAPAGTPVPALKSATHLYPFQIAPISRQAGKAATLAAQLLYEMGLEGRVTDGEDFHMRVVNDPFQPLVVERHGRTLYLTHYASLNGDLFIDSEVVFTIDDTGLLTLSETATSNPFGGGEYRTTGEKADRSFAALFLSNALEYRFGSVGQQQAIEQGYIHPKLTHIRKRQTMPSQDQSGNAIYSYVATFSDNRQFEVQAIDRTEAAAAAWRMRGYHPPEPSAEDEPELEATTTIEAASIELTATDRKVEYVPQSKAPAIGTLIPINLASLTAEALAKLEEKVGGNIDQYVQEQCGYASVEALWKVAAAEQIDAAAACIYNLERGKSAIVGDNTGVGKGRILALVLRYVRRKGKIGIFLTKGTELYVDFMRDVADVGMSGLLPFATNCPLKLDLPHAQPIHTTPKTHTKEMEEMIEKRSLLGYDLLFTSYYQLQTVKGKSPYRRQLLEALAPHAVLLFDESHCAGGGYAQTVNVNRAKFARRLRSRAAGSVFASATFCKEPYILDLYSSTDMSLAVEDPGRLTNLIYRGGTPMQEALSCQLAEAGQYLRRERSFAGIEFETALIESNRQAFDDLAACMFAVYDFDQFKQEIVKEKDKALKEAAKLAMRDNAIGDVGADSVLFTSIMHNLIEQALLAMKIDGIVDLVEKAIQNGEKPIIGMYNTFGSFIEKYAKTYGMKSGDPIDDADLGTIIHRYLDRCRIMLVRQPFSKDVHHEWITDADLGKAGVVVYNQARKTIDECCRRSLGQYKVSPIDLLIYELSKRGYRVGEVTGRRHGIRYDETGAVYYTRSAKETKKAATVKTVAAFNQGELDVLIMSQSGSTGISLHASKTFADQRPRRLIFAQVLTSVIDFLQMVGRINRTGQSALPKYTIALSSAPSEKRYVAILMQRLACLQATVIASRQGDWSFSATEDMFNDFGDAIVEQMMNEEPDLHDRLGNPLDSEQEFGSFGSPIERVTGRLAMLPIAEQERVYQQLEQRYREYKQQQESIGNSLLEARTIDIKARTCSIRELLPPGKGDSPFTAAVFLEEVEGDFKIEPLSQLDVINSVRQILEMPTVTKLEDNQFKPIFSEGKVRADRQAAELRTHVDRYIQSFLDWELPRLGGEYSESAREKREAKRERFKEDRSSQFNYLNALIKLLPIGTPVSIEHRGNELFGVVARIWRSERSENPVIPSSWRVQFWVADEARTLTLPASSVNNGPANTRFSVTPQTNYIEEYARFDEAENCQRRTAYLLTGNLLRAFNHFSGAGKIVHFTTADGQTRQGLLLRRNIDIDELIRAVEHRPIEIRTPEEAIQMIRAGVTLRSEDGLLNLRIDLDWLILETEKKTADGGKYFLFEALLEAAGDQFYSAGTKMRLKAPTDKMSGIFAALLQKIDKFVVAGESTDLAIEVLSKT